MLIHQEASWYRGARAERLQLMVSGESKYHQRALPADINALLEQQQSHFLIQAMGLLACYQTPNLELFSGELFRLTRPIHGDLGRKDALPLMQRFG